MKNSDEKQIREIYNSDLSEEDRLGHIIEYVDYLLVGDEAKWLLKGIMLGIAGIFITWGIHWVGYQQAIKNEQESLKLFCYEKFTQEFCDQLPPTP